MVVSVSVEVILLSNLESHVYDVLKLVVLVSIFVINIKVLQDEEV